MWTQGYIYGDYNSIKAFEAVVMSESEVDGEPCLDNTKYFKVSAIYPQRKSGVTVDENGNEQPVYSRIISRLEALVLIAVSEDVSDLIAVAESYGLIVHLPASKEEMAELYPEFALGQVIPYIC